MKVSPLFFTGRWTFERDASSTVLTLDAARGWFWNTTQDGQRGYRGLWSIVSQDNDVAIRLQTTGVNSPEENVPNAFAKTDWPTVETLAIVELAPDDIVFSAGRLRRIVQSPAMLHPMPPMSQHPDPAVAQQINAIYRQINADHLATQQKIQQMNQATSDLINKSYRDGTEREFQQTTEQARKFIDLLR